MRRPPVHDFLIAAIAAICVLAGCTTTTASVEPLAVPSALRLEGVPALPASVMAPLERYNRVAGHEFAHWHPTAREMLVRHRAPGASVAQLFRLRSPMGVPEPLTDGTDPVVSAKWEPQRARFIVFARGTGGDEAYQLYRLDPTTRAATVITPPGQRHAVLDWVPSRSLAVVGSVPLDRTATGGRRTEVATTLSLIDPLNPSTRTIVAELPGGGWFMGAVSPDEAQIALTRYVSATESEIWLQPLDGGTRRRLLPADSGLARAAYFTGGWSADGRTLFFTSDRAGEFRELMKIDTGTGAITRMTADTPWDVAFGSRSADGRTLAVTVNVDGRDELRLLDAETGRARVLTALPPGSASGAEINRASGEVAIVVNSTRGPAQIHTIDAAGGQTTVWTRPVGTEDLALDRLPDQQIVRWKAHDGRTISGILTLPPARFAGPRPVLMLVHGGPEAQARLGWRGRYNHVIESLGVALLEPNVRGSAGYGKTFISLDDGRLREDAVKDMGSAIDWISAQPRLDAQRVLVMGGSYGGYMALAAATRLTDRIAGAVSVVGISDFVSFLENTESYRRDLRRVEYGDERDPAMRAFLKSISPLSHVDKITKPLMVVQGRNDPRVPWTESEQIVRSLQARGTPVWYVLADNEGHGFARRENADFQFAALMRFIEETLRP